MIQVNSVRYNLLPRRGAIKWNTNKNKEINGVHYTLSFQEKYMI